MSPRNKKSWLQQHHRDHFVKQAQRQGYRSRATYKLQEIVQRDRILDHARFIVELGAAPGGWTQWLAENYSTGQIIAVDRLAMETIQGVTFIQGDFTEESCQKRLFQALNGQNVDLVLSDMAPNITGIRSTDQARCLALAQQVYEFSLENLRPGGHLLLKAFQGAGMDEFRSQMAKSFAKVVIRKPRASKLQSSELYILARNFRIV